MKKIWFVVGSMLVIALGLGVRWARNKFTVELPKYSAIAKTVWLDQSWTAEQREWFHSADQGTQTFGIPYEWFIALEQPEPTIAASGLLSDPQYLDRYGFIPSNTNSGKPGLPIGFAHGGKMHGPDGATWENPGKDVALTELGLTCAACHTGRFTYHNTSVLIDGGPALLDLQAFQKGVALSLLYTRYAPFRFDRFADRVLGSGASDEAKSKLKIQLNKVVSQINAISALEDKVEPQTVKEGYARLDALNRIGNTVFAIDFLNSPGFNSANFVGFSAPVHYPRIWDASWFEWVQYNGSIEEPMTRNAGEALGVLAQVNLTGKQEDLYSSSVRVDKLYEIEQLLAGKTPPDTHSGFHGLTSPKWPDLLPPINTDLAAKGAILYTNLCQRCHMAPVAPDSKFWTSDRWLPPTPSGKRYLNLAQLDLNVIGTDPAQAQGMNNRRIFIPSSLGISSSEFGPALGQLVDKVVDHWYDSQQPPTSEEVREQMNGDRLRGIRAPLSYKVRPLNGIWATPPYLHNGSVPSLYALLSPVKERPAIFYLGNREYDPVNVGYRVEAFPGGFEFDTTRPGNTNVGHEFVTGTKDVGVIGPYLSPGERLALIEYLKTL